MEVRITPWWKDNSFLYVGLCNVQKAPGLTEHTRKKKKKTHAPLTPSPPAGVLPAGSLFTFSSCSEVTGLAGITCYISGDEQRYKSWI